MFGHQAANALSDTPEPSLGAQVLNFAGRNLLGVDYLAMKRKRDEADQQKAMFGQIMGLIGGQAQQAQASPPATPPMQGPGVDGAPVSGPLPPPPAPPQPAGGMSINNPMLPALAMFAKNHGIDLGQAIDVMKAQQPHYQQASDGSFYNPTDPAMATRRLAKPDRVNDTILDYNDPKNWNRPIAAAPPQPSFGWEVSPTGALQPKKGGPADPAYIAQTTGVRRDAIVARPMPSKAKGHPGFSGLPPGY